MVFKEAAEAPAQIWQQYSIHGRIVDLYRYKILVGVRKLLARYNDPIFLEADLEISSMYSFQLRLLVKGRPKRRKESLSGSGAFFILIHLQLVT